MAKNPKEVTQMHKLISKIKANCPKLDYLEHLEEWVNSGVWSWPPRLKEVPAEKINRCGDVLNGPIYSCEGYEWPMYKNLPMVPFIQLDLKRCSRVSGVDFGTGLLQVWFGVGLISGKDAFIRVVPADQVHKDKLLPVPAFDMEKLFSSTPAYLSWSDIGQSVRGCWYTNATQIVSYKYRHFTLPHTYTFREEYEHECRKKQLPRLNKDCKQMIKEIDSMIEFSRERFGTGTHLMGTFSSVQYDPSETPTPLFCFEGEDVECYNFGDGNGQLFFVKDENGKITFSLDWSCL